MTNSHNQVKLEREEELLEQLKKYKENLKELSGQYEESDDEKEKVIDNDSSESEDADEEAGSSNENEEQKETLVEYEEWEGFQDDEDIPKGILKKREVYTSSNGAHDETEVVIEDISNGSLEEIAKANYVNLARSKEILEKSIERARRYAIIASEPPQTVKRRKYRYLSKTERRQNQKKAISNKRRRS